MRDQSMLNPDLNIAALAEEYRLDDRIRIRNVFKPEIAERIRKCCLSHVPFDFIFHEDGHNKVLTPQQMSALNSSQRKSMQRNVMQAASRGVGFLYCGYMMNRHKNPADESLAFLHQVYDSLKSKEVLATFMDITGRDDLSGVEGQYTRYTQGQFLTRHSDDIGKENHPPLPAGRFSYIFINLNHGI